MRRLFAGLLAAAALGVGAPGAAAPTREVVVGVTYLRETRAHPEADIFWVSAEDAFQTLKADGLLDKLALAKETQSRMPAKVDGFTLHDPDGQYWGFAVSGYGLMWNTRYLTLHKLPSPKEWTDLTDPRYFGHLSISAPSWSGTTHLTVALPKPSTVRTRPHA